LADDLNAPLGQDKRNRLPKLPVSAPQLLAGALGLSGLVVVAWAAFVSDPLGGEPTAVVATKLAPSTQMAREGDGDGKQHARHDGLASSPPAATGASVKTVEMPPPGSKTVTIIDGSSGARKEFTIPRSAEGNQQKKPDRSETDRGDQSRAPFRRLDLTVRARRPATRTRASFPKIRKIPPSLPLSSAASASALQAPPMRLPSFQQP
jgi:hypothetical protein